MPPDLDQLLSELADMHVFLDVDLTDHHTLAQYSSVPVARNLVQEATDAVARAQARPGDEVYARRALQAVAMAKEAVVKARGVVNIIRIRDTLRDKLR